MQILRCLGYCFLFSFATTQLNAQATATANADSGGAYVIFDAANFGVEGPDNSSSACGNGVMGSHDEFGDHITQVADDDLGQNVFEFHSHINEDSDRCVTFDRVRIEIKGGPSGNSDPELEHNYGNTSYYRWQFRIPENFVGNNRFCHLFQLKAQGGADSSTPVLTITARESSMEFRQSAGDDNPSGTRGSLATAPLDQFRGKWVEVFMELMHANNGAISMTIKDVASGNSLMSYGTRSIDLFRGDANQGVINRPKWGIYRARNDAANPPLKDEIVRFANFCSSENGADFCPSLLPDTGQPAAVGQPTPVDGARHVQTYMPISWLAANGADRYNIYFGDTPIPPLVETVSAPGYVPTLEENKTYYYQIGAVNASGETLSPVISFTTLFDADDGTWEVARGHARPDRESPQFFAFNTNLSGVGEIDTTALIPDDNGNVAHTFLSTENTTGNHNWRYRPEEDEEVTVVVRLQALPDNNNISYIDYRNAGYRMKCRMNRSTMRFEQAEGTTEEQSIPFDGFWDDEEFHVVRVSFARNPGGGIITNAYLDESTTPFATKVSTTEFSSSSRVDVGRAGGDNYGATIDFIAINPTGGIPPETSGKELPLDLLGTPLSIFAGTSRADLLRISPNPADNSVQLLDLPLERGGVFSILSTDGRVVSSGRLAPGVQTLSVDYLRPGLYFLKITRAGRLPAVARLVKR